MKKIIALIASTLLLSAARADILELEAYSWFMTPEGKAQVGYQGIEGTEVDLKDDLGYDQTENLLGAGVIIGQNHQLGLDFFRVDISAENIVERNITFSDLTFPFRTHVDSKLDASMIRGFYRFKLGPDTLNGGFLLGAQYVDVTAEASASYIGSASESVKAGMPVVGLFAESRPMPFINLRGVITGSTWKWEDVEASFVDVNLGAMFVIPPGITAGAGYRYLNIDGSDKGNKVDVDLDLSGPIVFVGFRW